MAIMSNGVKVKSPGAGFNYPAGDPRIFDELSYHLDGNNVADIVALARGKTITFKPAEAIPQSGDSRHECIEVFWTLLLDKGVLVTDRENAPSGDEIVQAHLATEENCRLLTDRLPGIFQRSLYRRDSAKEIVKYLMWKTRWYYPPDDKRDYLAYMLDWYLYTYVLIMRWCGHELDASFYIEMMHKLLGKSRRTRDYRYTPEPSGGEPHISFLATNRCIAAMIAIRHGQNLDELEELSESAAADLFQSGYAGRYLEDERLSHLNMVGIAFYEDHCAVCFKRFTREQYQKDLKVLHG